MTENTPMSAAPSASSAIIERVRKFLALAHSSNANEAASAAAHAHKLMLRHRLSQADVNGSSPSSIGEFDAPGDFSAAWRLALLTAVAKSYYSRTIRCQIVEPERHNGSRSVTPKSKWEGKIIGKREDADAILYIFGYFEAEIARLCTEHHYDVLAASEEDSFRRGAVYALQKKLLDQKKQFDNSSEKALVVAKRSDAEVKVFLDKKYQDREAGVNLGIASDSTGFYAGYNAGQSLNMPGGVKAKRIDSTSTSTSTSTTTPNNQNASNQRK